jgi:hypothetical protein
MVIYFSVMLLTALGAGFGIALRPVLRRALVATTAPPTSVPEAAAAAEPPTLELPAELQHLPEPPLLEAAAVEILDPPEITKRLRQLELGLEDLGPPLSDDHPVVASVLAAISDPATQKRLTPRRPNLLPQLMRAINDEDVSRRELSAIIARDPSMVGSLLKMANSAYYRVAAGRVESIERAVVILGSDGLRSLVASSILQPIFQINSAKVFARFPELVGSMRRDPLMPPFPMQRSLNGRMRSGQSCCASLPDWRRSSCSAPPSITARTILKRRSNAPCRN